MSKVKTPKFNDATNAYLEMTSDRHGQTEAGKEIPVGTIAKCCGHLPGCAVRIRLQDGTEHIVHPGIFPQLR